LKLKPGIQWSGGIEVYPGPASRGSTSPWHGFGAHHTARRGSAFPICAPDARATRQRAEQNLLVERCAASGLLRAGLAQRRIQHTTRYSQLSAAPFKDFWR